jgi:hypothetical protein
MCRQVPARHVQSQGLGILAVGGHLRDDVRSLELEWNSRPDLFYDIDWNSPDHTPKQAWSSEDRRSFPSRGAMVQIYRGKWSGQMGKVLFSDPHRVVLRGPVGPDGVQPPRVRGFLTISDHI